VHVEAIRAIDIARSMNSEAHLETEKLIERANCCLARDQFAEAYEPASQVKRRNDGELGTLAMQYMAEARLGQRRTEEALNLHRELQEKLPCRLVDQKRIETGVREGMTYLENAIHNRSHSECSSPFLWVGPESPSTVNLRAICCQLPHRRRHARNSKCLF